MKNDLRVERPAKVFVAVRDEYGFNQVILEGDPIPEGQREFARGSLKDISEALKKEKEGKK